MLWRLVLTISTFSAGLSPAWAELPFIVKAPSVFYKPSLRHFRANLSQCYQVVIIEHNTEDGLSPDSPQGQAIIQLAERGKQAALDTFENMLKTVYQNDYPDPQAALTKMAAEDRIFSLHSSRILVLECGKPLSEARILGGLRIVADGDNGKGLDLETSIPGYVYPRQLRWTLPFLREDGRWHAMKPLLTGGVLQATGYFNHGLPEIGALLFLLASDLTLRQPDALPEVLLTPSMREDFAKLTGRPLEQAPYLATIEPSEVVAYSETRIATKYYMRSMKFENVDLAGKFRNGHLRVLRHSWADFAKIAKDNLPFRPGYRLLSENGIEMVYEQTSALEQVVQHFAIDGNGWHVRPGETPVPIPFWIPAADLDHLGCALDVIGPASQSIPGTPSVSVLEIPTSP